MSEETYVVRRKNQINKRSEVVNVNIPVPKENTRFEVKAEPYIIQDWGMTGATGATGPMGAQGLTGATGPKSDSYLTIYTDYLTIPKVDDSVDILIEKDLAYTVGQNIIVSHDILHYFYGQVVDYDKETGYIHINVTQVKGGGRLRNWYINIAGPNSLGFTGADGPTGPIGPTGPAGPVGPVGLGLRSYAYFYTTDVFTVTENSSVNFNKNMSVSDDISLTNSLILIGTDGVYNISYYVSTDETNQFCIDINGQNLDGSIYNSNNMNHGNIITNLKAGDLVSLKNIGSNITLKKHVLLNSVTSSITLLKLS